MMIYAVFSLILFYCKILPFPYLFSFDEPRSISDLGLNRDLRTIEYGEKYGNITYLDICVWWNWWHNMKIGYMGIIAINMKFDNWVLPLKW